MTGRERLDDLTRWFDRVFAPAAAPEVTEPGIRPPLAGPLALEADYFAIVEIAWQSTFFGTQVPVSEWADLAERIAGRDWTEIRARFSGVERAQLAERLRVRFTENVGDTYEVPGERFLEFLHFSASRTMQEKFATFARTLDGHERALVALAGSPHELAAVLLSDGTSSITHAARAVNDALEFIVRRYTMVRALDSWPVVQSSIGTYLDDAGWALQGYPRLFDDCVEAMSRWTSADGTTDEEAERIRAHVGVLREATSAMFINAIA